MSMCMDAKQLRAALREIEIAEANGFMHCLAVFRFASAGPSISDNLMEYSDLIERAHPTDGRYNWGRCQSITKRYRFADGELVPLKEIA